MALANQSMLRRPVPARYATVFYASITPDGRLTYSNAGHLPPLLIGRSGRRWLDRGGMVVGLFELAAFEEETVQLQEGDRLIVFSDGVTEAVNTKGEEFGDERLAVCVEDLGISPQPIKWLGSWMRCRRSPRGPARPMTSPRSCCRIRPRNTRSSHTAEGDGASTAITSSRALLELRTPCGTPSGATSTSPARIGTSVPSRRKRPSPSMT